MDFQSLRQRMEDVSAVLVTPMAPDLSIDEANLRRHVRSLVDAGARLLVAGGNTGEFYTLTPEERRRVTAAVCAAAGDAVVVAGVGLAVDEAVAEARHAQASGAHAVMVHHPVHPYLHPDGLIEYYRRIAAAVDIGVVLYVRDPAIGPEVLEPVLSQPNVVGIKYGVNDLQLFADLVARFPADQYNVAWLCGTAEAWAHFFWMAGARGFTSGLVNVAPRLALAMLSALRSMDLAEVRRLWRLIKPFEDARTRYRSGNNVAVVKAAMALQGRPVGASRPPAAELRAAERSEVADILKTWAEWL